MLHDVALFIQNTFECTLHGSKSIICDVHNQTQKRSKNASENVVVYETYYMHRYAATYEH